MDHFQSAGHVADVLRPDVPVTCLRPHAATRAARWFVEHFDGDVLYAVKANPAPEMLRALWAGGVRRFDVASLSEVKLVRGLFPDAMLALMHPVKSAATIRAAYFDYGVRVFALDSDAELAKILAATDHAADLTLCVRLSVANTFAKLSLGAKFGVSVAEAPALLLKTRQHAARLGLCFHVGSQTMSPTAYSAALEAARKAITRAGVVLDVLDVGGGFPALYPGMTPPGMALFMDEITAAIARMPITETCEVWCEPGRALVAEATSVLVKVEARKDDRLYINDGTYGSLFDAGTLKWVYPTRLLAGNDRSAELQAFSFYGPTCDDLDFMEGPFMLPDDVGAGDYIEIAMLGAYGAAMRTGFNGFHQGVTVTVDDEPIHSAYTGDVPQREVIRLPGER
ncbi:MAG: type III PLP-dependent enzyme [Sphingomonadales bacterium]